MTSNGGCSVASSSSLLEHPLDRCGFFSWQDAPARSERRCGGMVDRHGWLGRAAIVAIAPSTCDAVLTTAGAAVGDGVPQITYSPLVTRLPPA